MITRSIDSWSDLERFGIVALTGEACGYAMRLLCDVTAEGKGHIERFLGGTVEVRKDSNWNGGSNVNPHVGSVLLPRGIFVDLAAFLLLRTGDKTVFSTEDGRVLESDGPVYEVYRPARVYRRSTDPGTGDRNTHMMSGRTE